MRAPEGTLRLPGRSLYYKVRGSGPLLLILQGGASDADGSESLVGRLVDRYTVVTYDRRGLSRSTVDDRTAALSLEVHGDDAPAVRRYRLDIAALRAAPTRIVPAAGQTSSETWPHRCAAALAERLDRELVQFPGGHAGYVMHPRGFAARLGEVLDGLPGGDAK